MSNTQRPSLQKSHTRSSEGNRGKALDESFGISVEGVDYVLTPSDLTGVQEMRIRKETGYSVATLIRELQSDPGVDLIGIFMWACELSQGNANESDLERILSSVSYATEVEVKGEAEPTPPEA